MGFEAVHRQMLGRALDAGVPAAWVTADEAYGKDYKFRSWLEQRRIGYVVAVACNQVIPGSTGTSRADVAAAHAPQQAWKRRSCGEGAKGPRIFDWAVASLPCYEDTTPPGWSRWLLVRRSLTRNSKEEHELAYYLCCAPAGTADDELIRVAGARWAVEVGHRWHRSRHAAFSWLCSLFVAGLLFRLCPAGAGVEARRAGSAFA